jgi:NIPSNAP
MKKPVIAVSVVFTLFVTAAAALLSAEKKESTRMHTVEIRSYNLKPGTRARFHQVATEQALPMLHGAKIDVVANGPSLHDDNSYFLIRNFASVDDRQKKEDTFYNSDEWKQGPREAIMACIDSYTTVVVQVDDATLAGLRKLSTQAGGKE